MHHTKDKGDLGVAKAFADLTEQGFLVLFPATEHAPFDLVAYDGAFHRIQVKYRSLQSGAVTVRFMAYWADRHGVHSRPMDKEAVDVVRIYCPDTDACYYVRPAEHCSMVRLRVAAPRNNQQVGVLRADDFRMFDAARVDGTQLGTAAATATDVAALALEPDRLGRTEQGRCDEGAGHPGGRTTDEGGHHRRRW